MATGTLSETISVSRQKGAVSLPYAILKALGSLKITTTMFALGILIVLFGTLAQDEMDMASVKREFFTCWIASVPFDVLFPITLFPHDSPILGGYGVYFPGGATIGFILLINLIAAKVTRFSIQAKGSRLVLGTLISLLGAALITGVIVSGHAVNGLQGKPPVSYDVLWGWLKIGLAICSLAILAYAIFGKMPALSRVISGVGAAISVALTLTVMTGGESVRLDDPGLRIVWQLLQASIASCVALAGLWILFGKRGGNVLIHAGVGLLMVGQFVFGDRQVEQRISMAEGASTNLAVIEDELEVALIDTSEEEEDVVYAIPEWMLRKYDGSDRVIDDELLPCKIRIVAFMRNSRLAEVPDEGDNVATLGLGLSAIAKAEKEVGGAMQDARNIAAAYVELIDRDSDEQIGVVMLSQAINDASQLTRGGSLSPELKAQLSPRFLQMVGGVNAISDRYEEIKIGDKPFQVAIRFRQERKPYDVYLKDVERIDYSGTETPRDYSSRIVITDRESGDSQEDKTWMNNPIRYRGETFYQSRYDKLPLVDGSQLETTGLQVVENAGWVIPYVCCMMVFWGMFAHFGGTFSTFANRYSRGSIPTATSKEVTGASESMLKRVGVVAIGLGVCVVTAGYFAKPTSYARGEVNWEEIRNLPVQHEGRIKPFDTVARNLLQRISEPIFGSVPYVKDGNGEKRLPSEWLMGVMADQEWVRDATIFRIYAPEVRNMFDLEKRKYYRYSMNELEPKLAEFREKLAPLVEKKSADFTYREKKMAELQSKLNLYEWLSVAYLEPPMPDLTGARSEAEGTRILQQLERVYMMMQRIEDSGTPAVIPPLGDATRENLVDATWQAYSPAKFNEILRPAIDVEGKNENLAVAGFTAITAALAENDAPEVNKAVKKYKDILTEMPLANATVKRASAESWLNKFDPTAQGVVLYLIAVIVGFASFMTRGDSLRKATFWMIVGVFLIHTIAIISRIYISGRAPVINLYSSAVFIGWACVLLSLFLEVIYPIGIANLVGALIGVVTISVARFLDTSDTLPVLQAVLDTQFWLSTHVITVTAGYAVTFLAGFLGIFALGHRVLTGYDSYAKDQRPQEASDMQQILYRMTYGSICFAIFFSFIGTVLGGLWADDSWGRFWGWDPKENGAMMIVLWNALILHARWDQQVGQRGFAALAVFGNIVTTWSWFGTNQLGIGLHSYGFTSGALIGLSAFMSLNLLFIVVTMLITRSMAVGANRNNDGAA